MTAVRLTVMYRITEVGAEQMDDAKMDIRWKQRYMHYKKAYAILEQTIAIEDSSNDSRKIWLSLN